MGAMKTQSAMQMRQHSAPLILRQSAGPISYESILKGFKLNSSLPTGGGK
jgi:hypothetical protein